MHHTAIPIIRELLRGLLGEGVIASGLIRRADEFMCAA